MSKDKMNEAQEQEVKEETAAAAVAPAEGEGDQTAASDDGAAE